MRGVAKAKAAKAQKDEEQGSSGLIGDKYGRILDAAVDVIAENGYFQSPVSKIAERAGVADGTVYLYFKNKDDLLRSAIDRLMQQFYDGVEREFERVTDPVDWLLSGGDRVAAP